MNEQLNDELENQESENIETEEKELADTENVNAGEENQEETEGELVVHFGEEENAQDEQKESAPAWVKEVRKQNRELAKRVKEFEQKEAERNQVKPQTLRAKPTLADFDYDAEAFEADLLKWTDEKKSVEKRAENEKAEIERQQKEWEETVASFNEEKKSFKVSDYQEKQEEVESALSPVQQGIILAAIKNRVPFVYGIGSNPAKLNELKLITDPIKFTAAIVRLEETMKQTSKKAPPPAEKKLSGSAAHGGSYEKELEKLREGARKTGDYSELSKFKAKHAKKT